MHKTEQIKFIDKNIAETVKNIIPAENVLTKLFSSMEYKKDRSTAKIKVFKDTNNIAFVFTNSNTLTLKNNIDGQTIATGDSINLVQKTLNKNFKDAVLWLLREFDLIKSVENGEIILDDKEIQAIQQEFLEEKEKNLHELELKEEIARQQIQYFKQIGTLQVDKDIRGVNKDLINLIAKDGDSFKIVKNKEKGNRTEFKVALKDNDNNIDGIQTIYYNIYQKKWDKRNTGRANVSYFGNKNAKNIVVVESFFDGLSAVEVMAKMGNVSYKEILDNYLVISINGQYSSLKNNTIRQFLAQAQQIILSHDNDGAGENFDKMFLIDGVFWENVKDKEVYVLKPANFKDLNDFVRSQEFQEDNIKKHLILGDVEIVYLDYINNVKFQKQMEELEKEEQREVTISGEKEEQQQEQEQQSFSPEQVSKTFNLSEILGELKQTKTTKGITNYFYKIEDNTIKFTRLKAKEKGIKATGVFFREGAYVELNADGTEKGTGAVALMGKNVNKIEDTENVIFANNIISAFKLAKAKGVDISRSFIFVVKNVSRENKILFDNFSNIIFGNANNLNAYATLNKNKSGEFLAELISENPNTKIMQIDVMLEDGLKGVKVINDVITPTNSGKEKQLALEF